MTLEEFFYVIHGLLRSAKVRTIMRLEANELSITVSRNGNWATSRLTYEAIVGHRGRAAVEAAHRQLLAML